MALLTMRILRRLGGILNCPIWFEDTFLKCDSAPEGFWTPSGGRIYVDGPDDYLSGSRNAGEKWVLYSLAEGLPLTFILLRPANWLGNMRNRRCTGINAEGRCCPEGGK